MEINTKLRLILRLSRALVSITHACVIDGRMQFSTDLSCAPIPAQADHNLQLLKTTQVKPKRQPERRLVHCFTSLIRRWGNKVVLQRRLAVTRSSVLAECQVQHRRTCTLSAEILTIVFGQSWWNHSNAEGCGRKGITKVVLLEPSRTEARNRPPRASSWSKKIAAWNI